MNKRSKLQAILQDDPYGLLDPKTIKQRDLIQVTPLIIGFEEIIDFFEDYSREPQIDTMNTKEFQLACRLKSIRQDPRKIKILKSYDLIGLLGSDLIEATIDDLIAHDEYGLLDDVDTDIFELKHVKKSDRISPEYLSRRKFCKNFDKYHDMFVHIQDDLSNRKRSLVIYNPKDLVKESFFVLNGMLLYFETVNGEIDSYGYLSGNRTRFDGRTRCIFSNGTESDMLYRSLDKALQKDGYSISNIDYGTNDQSLTPDDVQNGYIYILKSRNYNLRHYDNLFKIGFTSSTVTERIKNAKNEATYLFDDVEIISVFRCYNISAFAVEQAIHSFFSNSRLDIDLYDNNGELFQPKEWFTVGVEIIRQCIELIIDGHIEDYIYDCNKQQIFKIAK